MQSFIYLDFFNSIKWCKRIGAFLVNNTGDAMGKLDDYCNMINEALIRLIVTDDVKVGYYTIEDVRAGKGKKLEGRLTFDQLLSRLFEYYAPCYFLVVYLWDEDIGKISSYELCWFFHYTRRFINDHNIEVTKEQRQVLQSLVDKYGCPY